MEEKTWIKRAFHYTELKEVKIKHIMYFGLIWSIFENRVFSRNANIKNSDDLALKLN